MRFKPNSTVATIIEKDGSFLCVKEGDPANPVFNQPAGHIEHGESIMEAALRETLEETGCTVELTGYLGLYTYTAPSNQTMYHRHCFAAKLISFDDTYILDEGILGTKWITLDTLIESKQARSPLVIKCIEDYLSRPALPLDIIYEHPND